MIKGSYMQRRAFLRGIGAGLCACAGRSAATSGQGSDANVPLKPLKSYAKPCGMEIGAQAVKPDLAIPALARFIAENFDLLTAGVELKWARVRPNPDTYSFDTADWMVSFAQQNRMRFHGHNLCWHAANPRWFASVLTKENARRYLTDHITTVVRRYAGIVQSWDVVNEPLSLSSKRPDLLSEGPWLDLLGPEYFDVAFNAAAEADPKALRILNVYQVEIEGGRNEDVRRSTLALIRDLLSRKVPLQAIGLQSHMSGTVSVASPSRNRFVRELRDLGLQVLITELDVNDAGLPSDFDKRDQAVAATYRNYLLDIMPAASPKQVMFWSVTDKANWYNDAHGVYFDRKDGLLHRPGLLDDKFAPKVALSVVAAAFGDACRTVQHNGR